MARSSTVGVLGARGPSAWPRALVPLPSITGERRAEISGHARSASLLRDQEPVCLPVVARARNHLQADRPLEFRFEIVI